MELLVFGIIAVFLVAIIFKILNMQYIRKVTLDINKERDYNINLISDKPDYNLYKTVLKEIRAEEDI